MTIIKPNQDHKYLTFIISIFIIILIGSGYYIYQYNHLVDLRYKIDSSSRTLIKAQADNADLENQFYQITDSKRLKELAVEEVLILDRQPNYLNLKEDKWLSVSLR